MNLIFKVMMLAMLLIVSGCGTMGKDLKNLLSGKPAANNNVAPTNNSTPKDSVTFSEMRNVPINQEREYRRMTRAQFEANELSGERAGSLWVMEGQDSYLFAENIVRLPGDLLNVVIDGQPEKQLTTKAKVISDLTKRLEDKRRKLASTPNAAAEASKDGDANAAGAAAESDKAASEKQASATDDTSSSDVPFDVKEVPVRIVERLSDGNYRVKGSQTFMIGSKEYKVIATGLVKPTDVNQNKVESSKMLDSKFDIVKYK